MLGFHFKCQTQLWSCRSVRSFTLSWVMWWHLVSSANKKWGHASPKIGWGQFDLAEVAKLILFHWRNYWWKKHLKKLLFQSRKMMWLLESRVLRVLLTPVLQCTSQMFLHWCHIRHSEVVSPSLGRSQTFFSEFKACVGNVMLLKRGQQVLLCRYPAYAQMVRVPRAALWILLCWSNDYWQKELCIKWYIYI